MAFTTSFFIVSPPSAGGAGERTMDVVEDAEAGGAAGSRRMSRADTDTGVDNSQPQQQPASESHCTAHISPLPIQEDEGSHLNPEEPNLTEHHQDNDTSSQPNMAPKQPIRKKKGTATAIPKPPKRGGKGGSGSKKGSGKATKKKQQAPKTDNNQADRSSTIPDDDNSQQSENDGGSDGDGDGDESDQGIYCICRGPDNHRFMIACDRCEDWFHGDCIGMDKYTGENLVQRYICPNCTDGRLYVTRYKKTCALEGCERPARMYGELKGGEEASIFCSEEHCQLWWEQLVATLPRGRHGGLYGDVLTQEEFMGLLGGVKKGDGRKWRLGEEPFGIPANFWDTVPPSEVLTEEESTLLANSVADRHSLGEEIVLCKKMLQLIDLAVKQRETLIATSASSGAPKSQLLGKDFCGYDYRLDTVGATAAFTAFVKTPLGESILRNGRLPLPGDGKSYKFALSSEAEDPNGHVNGVAGTNGAGVPSGLHTVMCVKKKCKPHAGWSGIHTKNVKHQIKELAAQAKEKLDFEARIRDCAAVRYQRRKRENNRVVRLDGDVEMED